MSMLSQPIPVDTDCNPLSLICSRNRSELAAGDVTLLSVEMGCHGGDTPRVAHEDDFICQLFRFYVEMENASVLVDDKF